MRAERLELNSLTLFTQAALRAKMLAEELAAGASSWELATEVVEEFISIADGQVVLEGPKQRAQQLGQLSLELGQQHQPGGWACAERGVGDEGHA